MISVRTVILVSILLPSLASAQSGASLPRGRHCDKTLSALGWPALGDVIDSLVAAEFLVRAAGPTAPVTALTIRYDTSGLVRDVTLRGVTLDGTETVVVDSVRKLARRLPSAPTPFSLMIARLNASGYVQLVAGTSTCWPERHTTARSTSIIRNGVRRYGTGTGGVVLGYWLNADATIRGVWIEQSSGIPTLDSIAVQALHAMRFEPALVGATPVSTLMRQPFTFR